MHSHWKIIHRELRDLLKEPLFRFTYARLRQTRPELHRWPQAQLVSSFLARQTSPLELREDVARILAATTAGKEDGAQVAGTILVLAGALLVSRMGRGSGSPPASALPWILGHFASTPPRIPVAASLLTTPTERQCVHPVLEVA
jgi:uncharacterized protein YcfJ